jgi:hypothetical protein
MHPEARSFSSPCIKMLRLEPAVCAENVVRLI